MADDAATSLRWSQMLSSASQGMMPLHAWRPVLCVVIDVVHEQKSEGASRVRVDIMDMDTRAVYSGALALGWSGSKYQLVDPSLKPVTKNLNSGFEFSTDYVTKIGELQADVDINGWNGDVVVAIPVRHKFIIIGATTHPHANEDIEDSPYDDTGDALFTKVDEPIGPQIDALNEKPWPTVQRNAWPDVHMERFGALFKTMFEDRGIVWDVRETQTSDPNYKENVLAKFELRKDRSTLRGPEIQLRTGIDDEDSPAGVQDAYKTLIDAKDSGVRVHASQDTAHIDLDIEEDKGLRVQKSGDTGKAEADDYHGVVKFPKLASILNDMLSFMDELRTEYNKLKADHDTLRTAAIGIKYVGPGTLTNPADALGTSTSSSVSTTLPTGTDVDNTRSTKVTVGKD